MPKSNLTGVAGPHENAEVLVRGNTKNPKTALLLFHGRGSNAKDILGLSDTLLLADTLVCAPEAAGHEWYPYRFLAPRSENEPHLSSALDVVDALVKLCDENYRIKPNDIILAGFSQGACLVADYIARTPQKYRGVCIFSGGLIGSDEQIAHHMWKGSLEHTPVYLGCDERDPHIPRERVLATAAVLENLHADLTTKLYAGLGHTVHREGIEFLRQLFS